MPTIFEWKGWKFLFYSLDGVEPAHVHVRKDRKECKIWLGDIKLAKNRRCTDQELNEIMNVIRATRPSFWRNGMNTLEIDHDLLEPVAAECTDAELVVTLADGVRLATPLWWYPRLLAAGMAERSNIELSAFGVHWPELDEDLSIEGMLKGRKAPNAIPPAEAAE